MNELTTTDLRDVLADLPYLVAVAESGGVTAAADELRVPQPTVSRGLARLARTVGASMLTRDGRGVELSAEARELLPYARRALDAVTAGTDVVSKRAAERADTASVAFQNTLGRTVVPALLRAVLDVRPSTRFQLHQRPHELCVEMLEASEADIVLVSPPYAGGRDTETVRLYDEPLVLAVPLSHPLAHRKRVRLRQLAGERMLQMRPEFGLRGQVDSILRTAGVEPERGFEGEDAYTVRGLVAVGLGVAILPPAHQPFPDVVEIPIAEKSAIREIGVSWRTGGDPSPAARALFDIARRSDEWLPRPDLPLVGGARNQA